MIRRVSQFSITRIIAHPPKLRVVILCRTKSSCNVVFTKRHRAFRKYGVCKNIRKIVANYNQFCMTDLYVTFKYTIEMEFNSGFKYFTTTSVDIEKSSLYDFKCNLEKILHRQD